jgi:hypothetical protein
MLVFFLPAILVIVYPGNASAQGDLMLTPRRMVFDGQKKTQELNIANIGKDTVRYVISLFEVRMKEDGGFELITQPDSGQQFASGFVRFFPRSVVLGPGETQLIKVQVIKQSALLAGEYRSHLYLRGVPDEKPLGEKSLPQDTTNIQVQLKAVFGISIPVIIRVGESTAVVDISNTSFAMADATTPVMNMVFHRTGNMSVYGTIKVDFITPQGKIIKVAEVMGVAVYNPTPSRSIRIALNNNLGIDYKAGKLHVEYTTEADTKVKSFKMAAADLVLF